MRARLLPILCIITLGLFSFGGCRKAKPEQDLQVQPPVAQPEAAFGVTVEPASITLEPGTTVKIIVNVIRKDFVGPLSLEVRNLPADVKASSASLSTRQGSAEIELTAALSAAAGEKKNVQVIALAGELHGSSPAFAVSVARPSLGLTIDPARFEISPGESRPLKITVKRKPESYQGPVEIELPNLPKYVKALPRAKGQDASKGAEFVLQAGPEARVGESLQQMRVLASNHLLTEAPFKLAVLGPPFVLQAEPQKVHLVYGQTSKLKISAVRDKQYQGPIQVHLENLPAHVKAKPLTLSPKQTSGEIELHAGGDAASFEKSVQVRGSTSDNRPIMSHFDLKLEGRPFALQLPTQRLDVVQGASAKLKIAAIRSKDFPGPIDLEVRNLPKHCKASSLRLDPQGKNGEIEITAGDDAAPGDKAGIQVVGIAEVGGEKREVKLENLVVRVLGPFALHVQPGKVEMLPGSKSILKVSAERRTYKGLIAVELRNLQEGVVAAKGEIPEDRQSVELELAAAPTSAWAEKKDVYVLGTSDKDRQISSRNFTVVVVRKLFDLKTQPAVKLTVGGKTLLKVSAQRKEYQGPIALELKNLPAALKASKVILPAGQNDVDVEIAAADQAKESKIEAQVVGTTLEGGSQQRTSPSFTVNLLPGFFDLKLEPSVLSMNHGGSAKLKVIALRKGFDGPIAIELRNLPAAMKADKATIAKGENQAEIELKSSSVTPEGDKVDVQARGSVAGKVVDSSRFTVSVVSIGQPRGLELKVEPAILKVAQGGSVQVKIVAVRKGYTGPIPVELRNLPPEVKSSKGMIATGENAAEITLSATPRAEPGSRADVCAVGIATDAADCPYASGHVTLQVMRK